MSRCDPGETILYRIWGDDPIEPLYIGISQQVEYRLRTHAREKWWWGEARHATTQWFPTRREAVRAEWKAIRLENPRYNLHRPEPYFDWDERWQDVLCWNPKYGDLREDVA